MSKFLSLLKGIEHIDGEVVDDAPHVTHEHRIRIDGTHAAIGRILAERHAQEIAHKQRMKDAQSSALIQGAGIFAAIRAAFKSLSKETKEENVGFGMSESSGGSGGGATVDHSCTSHGDWGEYGYY